MQSLRKGKVMFGKDEVKIFKDEKEILVRQRQRSALYCIRREVESSEPKALLAGKIDK